MVRIFGSAREPPAREHPGVGMRGNFIDVPTKLPTGDERVGWTGDIQVFAPTASFLFDASGSVSGLGGPSRRGNRPATRQRDPVVCPGDPRPTRCGPRSGRARPGACRHSDAVDSLRAVRGIPRILAAQFDSASRWVDLVASIAGPDRLWNTSLPSSATGSTPRPRRDSADAATRRAISSRLRTSRSPPAPSRGWPQDTRAPNDKAPYVASRRRDRRRIRSRVRYAGTTDNQRRPEPRTPSRSRST